MAARAARAGHVVRGYDVVPGRAASLAGDGVRPADTVAAAADGADLLVIMVATPEQAEEALFAPGGAAGSLAAGSIVVVMATVGLEAVVSAADRLAARGVAVVDAPVSGGTARAAAGDLLIMVSGPEEPVARAQPVLSALARSLTALRGLHLDGTCAPALSWARESRDRNKIAQIRVSKFGGNPVQPPHWPGRLAHERESDDGWVMPASPLLTSTRLPPLEGAHREVLESLLRGRRRRGGDCFRCARRRR